ncbi:EcsC family protein [Desulfonema magnum]|nr:EcsC family protein [Desulfonema magnum]
MALDNVIAEGIKKMAMVDYSSDRMKLRYDARKHSLPDWRAKSVAKVGAVGGLTGLSGGPWALALEAGDIAYLMSMAGRACYGVGYILGKEVDYRNDIPNILAVWCGAADAVDSIAAGKVGIKIAGKKSVPYAMKAGAKIVSKTALKGSSKAMQKVLAKVAGKLAAKLSAKVGTKWIPIVGGIVSAGINGWVASGLLDAAEAYYKHDYLQFTNWNTTRNFYDSGTPENKGFVFRPSPDQF